MPVRLTVHEDDVQAGMVQMLELLGFTVLVTSRRRRKCWHCGRYPSGGDGVTKGTPDLFVYDPRIGGWVGLEVKGPKTAVSAEQQALADDGKITIVRTLEDVCAALGVNAQIGG